MKLKTNGWRIVLRVTVAVLAAVGIYLIFPYAAELLFRAISIFLPFILGYVFSLAINPLADKLQKKFRLPRGVCAILVIILTVGIVGGILTGVIWKIVAEIKSLYSQYPKIYSDAVELWENISDKYSKLYIVMPDGIQNMFDNLGSQISSAVTGFFEKTPVIERAGNVAKSLPGIFIALIVFFLSLYFMVTDAQTVSEKLNRIIPLKVRERIAGINAELKKYMGGYVKAQCIIMSVAFVILMTGLTILQKDYALLIAIGIAVLDALPFFGSGAVLWPWALVSFLSGSVKSGVGLIIIYLIIVLTRQTIEPKIVSSKIGLHPILTLMAMYVGYRTFSIGGMILGPLTLMLIISFYRAGIFAPVIKGIKKLGCLVKREQNRLKNLFVNKDNKREE